MKTFRVGPVVVDPPRRRRRRQRSADEGPYYGDWLKAYHEERHRGVLDGVATGVTLSGRPNTCGEPVRPDVSTRPKGRRRYTRKGG